MEQARVFVVQGEARDNDFSAVFVVLRDVVGPFVIAGRGIPRCDLFEAWRKTQDAVVPLPPKLIGGIVGEFGKIVWLRPPHAFRQFEKMVTGTQILEAISAAI